MSEPSYRVVRVDTAADLDAALAIRQRVFTEEQGIPAELELDGHDEASYHILVLCDDQPVATGRWREEPAGEADLARIAVVKEHRGKKLSAVVVMELEAWARDLGMRRAWLEPHIYLERLYGGLGYLKAGMAAKAGDHQLIRMEKELNEGEA